MIMGPLQEVYWILQILKTIAFRASDQVIEWYLPPFSLPKEGVMGGTFRGVFGKI